MTNPTDREIAETLAGVLGWTRRWWLSKDFDIVKKFRSLDTLAGVRRKMKITSKSVSKSEDGWDVTVRNTRCTVNGQAGPLPTEEAAEALALYRAAKARGERG